MGINLRDILVVHPEEDIRAWEGRVLALDAYNSIYQYLSSIRQPDGTPLMDSQGRVTSHLSGVLYRTSSIMAKGVRMVFVFDGPPHPLKKGTLDARREVREMARKDWKVALEEGDIEGARMKAQQTSVLDKTMVAEVKDLLDAMGIPWVDAPGDGEAQASHMNARGDVWAVASQDYDSLLFGSELLVRNATLSGRRKLPGRGRREYVQVVPERVDLRENLRAIGLTREQLVDAAILVGTDFNPGTKGIGPKSAIKLLKANKDLEGVLRVKDVDVEHADEIR
ncbi:MAG: flap endonuclease-1, partial [Thermoplasmata archaeon]|nr:flap endonuclease-1 [Thermoplasmata archaeon]